MEEELHKCALAAFEVPASLNVVEYQQMLLPGSVAGATAPVGKAKLNHHGLQSPNAGGARTAQSVLLLTGWCSEADLSCSVRPAQSCAGPALHQDSHMSYSPATWCFPPGLSHPWRFGPGGGSQKHTGLLPGQSTALTD